LKYRLVVFFLSRRNEAQLRNGENAAALDLKKYRPRTIFFLARNRKFLRQKPRVLLG
jgi:hypothetical protein